MMAITRTLKTERLFESGAFLFLVVPSMFLSFLVVRQGNMGFVVTASATILRDLALATLIAYFLWRNDETREEIGWRFRGSRDIVLGVLLFAVVFLAAGYVNQLLRSAGLSHPATTQPRFLTAQGPAEYVLALLLVAVAAVAEEVIFRGYMILRFTEITGSTMAAIVLSTTIFALGHGYEGMAGMAVVAFLGLSFAVVYVWTGSLVAPIIMHFLQDFIGIIAVPLLKHG